MEFGASMQGAVALAASRFSPLGPEAMAGVLTGLRATCAVDFTGYRPQVLARRVRERMRTLAIDDVAEYLAYAAGEPSEFFDLCRTLQNGVTSFFRDPAVFDALAANVLPRIFAERNGAPVRIWCAGCSTGEEAYSLAITLLEHLGERAASHRIQIFATDLDPRAVAFARQGTYPRRIEQHVDTARLERFFTKRRGAYVVERCVRDLLVFAAHDVAQDPPFSRLDLVSCRNVLIYMQPAAHHRVLRLFHYALRPEGSLLLGSLETVGEASDLFSTLDWRHKIFTRPAGVRPPPFDLLGASARVRTVHEPLVMPVASPGPAGRPKRPGVRKAVRPSRRVGVTRGALQAANEELTTANEELVSSNEELRATNEAIVTARDDAASANAELASLNEELQCRMAELGVHADDVANLLRVVSHPVVLVSDKLRIRRFSAAAETELHLAAEDIGRPLARVLKVFSGAWDERLAEVIAGGPFEWEARHVDGTRYRVRAAPYRTSYHAIRGAIVEFAKLAP
jgi:chemotaxis methyl-accepting protein methylase